jgi:hypothetical protein
VKAWENYIQQTGVESWDKMYMDQMRESFNRFMPKINELNDNQLENLQTIFMTFKKTDALLSPLKQAGLSYTLAVAGGSVYDLVLRPDAPISDCDILIYCDSVTNSRKLRETPNSDWEDLVLKHFPEKNSILRVYEKDEKETNQNSVANILALMSGGQDMASKPKVKLFSYNNDVFVDLVAKLLSDNHNHNYEVYRKDNDLVKDYLSNMIAGIIKLKPEGKNTANTDLIISTVRPADFVSSFDFDICKAYMIFSQEYQSCFDLLDSLVIHPACIHDVEDKTLSINCRNFTPEHVEYFLSKHYLKMKEKFPDHALNFYMGALKENENEASDRKRPHVAVYGPEYLSEAMKIVARHYTLQEKMQSWNLPESPESTITKIKI